MIVSIRFELVFKFTGKMVKIKDFTGKNRPWKSLYFVSKLKSIINSIT